MNHRSRTILAAASLILLVMYAAPLWTITLEAPQYPEGLGLRIHLTTIDGVKQHDLTNINNLNHYIGMQRIEPDAIPELRIMPWIIGFLIVFGLLAAATGKPWMLYTWTGLFVLLAIVGLIDFYLWAYDYGHNLDVEHAAIKVPGMTYQPPIIGSKKLLNFTAHSWPALGGWAAFVSMATGIGLTWLRIRSSRAATAAVVTVVAFMAVGCQVGPEPFVFGEDRDAYCRMSITDARFATQIVATTGKVYKFDSIECMNGFMASDTGANLEIHSIWVTDANSRELIPAEGAAFVHSDDIRSPMGGGFMAVASHEAATETAAQYNGITLDWNGLQSMASAGE